MHKFLLVATVTLAVAGCSKGADADGDGKVSEAEAKTEMAAGGAMVTKPGLWEMKMTFSDIKADGMPEAALAKMKEQAAKGMTMQSCMTKEQAEKPGTDFFGATPETKCTFDSLDRSGNNMKVAMTCKPMGKVIIKNKMEGTFAAESYTMNVEQVTDAPPMKPVTMKGKVEAKRIGDCPA